MQRLAGSSIPIFRDFAHARQKYRRQLLAEQYGDVRAVLGVTHLLAV